jgi:hypothetical protein
MKNKVLFYLDADFTHFSIAYFLQQKLDNCELYAIIDITNKPKNFFLNQKLVNFKKIWFLHDNIDPNYRVTNTDYLKKIADEYELDLWKIISNDRIFYGFFNFHKFSRTELLSLTEQQAKFFLNIINEINPNFLILAQPALFHSELLYELAKSSKIKCMVLSQPKIGGKCLISESVRKIDNIDSLEDLQYTDRTQDELLTYFQKKAPYKIFKKYYDNLSNSRSELLFAGFRYIINNNDHEKTHYTYFGRTKGNVILSTISGMIKKKIREKFMGKNLPKRLENNFQYIYFPMSVDMERNVLIDTPFYTNQIEIIRIVAKSLPINFRLVVKENPGQTTREWRKISEYKQIMSIPNTILIHPDFPSEKLIKNSSLVISLSGSSPLEATFYQKPAIVFGDVVYSLIPSIFKVNTLEQLPKLIEKAISSKVDLLYLNRFIDLIEKNTVNFDMFEFQTLFNKKFYYQGYLFDVEIDEEDIKKFLDEIKDGFRDITDYHVRKISENKEIKS